MKKSKGEEFEIPKTTRFLSLKEYDPANASLAGVGIWVWVDPPLSMLVEFDAFNHEYNQVLEHAAGLYTPETKKPSTDPFPLTWLRLIEKWVRKAQFKIASKIYLRRSLAWYARIWSQSPDVGTHMTVGELKEINDKNPRLSSWLCIHSRFLIKNHQLVSEIEAVKNAGTPADSGNVITPWGSGVPGEWLEATLAITKRVAKAKKQDRLLGGRSKSEGD